MGGDQATSSESASVAESPLKVNLQIVSPSIGVGTLSFSEIPAATTIRQLKEKIRDAIHMRPSNEQQRLIHRGRMLARDNDTLQDVLGVEALQTGDLQSLHLVVRDPVDHPNRAASNPSPLRNPSPSPGNAGNQTNPLPHQRGLPAHHPHHHLHHAMHANPNLVFPNAAQPGLPPTQLQQLQQQQLQQIQQQQLQQLQQQQLQQHQTILQWSNQLQREAGYRQLINQHQRERAMLGYHGIQGNPANNVAVPGNAGGRNSPALQQTGQTVTREMLGPNGQYYRITESINPSAGPPQPGNAPTSNPQGRVNLSPADVQNIIRGADATQATQAMTNAMHRSASGASLVNLAGLNANVPIQPIQPGVTRPISPFSSRHASRTATPDPSGRSSSSLGGGPAHTPTSHPLQQQQQPQPQSSTTATQPEVYILYSPTGPRGLLVNNPSEMYITPAIRQSNLPVTSSHLHLARPHVYQQPHPWQAQVPLPDAAQLQFPPLPPLQLPPLPTPHQTPQVPQPAVDAAQPRRVQVQGQAQAQNQQGQAIPAGQAGQANAVAHPNNPAAGAMAAALWPHIWLIIRLTAFVWWFTSGDSSWSRWLTMVAIAIVVFVINTGILNGAANQAWDPFRRHLEGLLPLQNPNENRDGQAPVVAATAGAAPNLPDGVHNNPAHPQLEPDPAQVAARLLAERRNANGNWLMDQIRRVERAGLLFLASIAPGVAERHIANLEQQERDERRRREAEQAAAAAAAVALEMARAGLEEQAQGGQDASNEGQTGGIPLQPREENRHPGDPAADEPPPLIPI